MRILVVCGAGASSTFVAQRVRRAAQATGRALSAVAGTEQSLLVDVDAADIVLVGPHLHAGIDDIQQLAASRGAIAVLLPADIFRDLDGTRTLAVVDAARVGGAAADPTPSERNPA